MVVYDYDDVNDWIIPDGVDVSQWEDHYNFLYEMEKTNNGNE